MSMFRRLSLAALLVGVLAMMMPDDLLSQRRSGSFGGKRSFSSPSRSYRSPSGGGSFGGRRSTAPTTRPSTSSPRTSTRSFSSPTSTTRNTFGGTRMDRPTDYTSRYGIPRQSTRQSVPTSTGSQQYVVNRYGGMGDGFMMGYLMGSIPWYYSMPFHPAFYYSRPYTVANTDGTTSVYPGTFQWGTLFFTLLLIGGVLFILYVWYRNRRRRLSGAGDMGDSSFA
jgi:hypothetical protein